MSAKNSCMRHFTNRMDIQKKERYLSRPSIHRFLSARNAAFKDTAQMRKTEAMMECGYPVAPRQEDRTISVWFSRKLFKFLDCLIYLYVMAISSGHSNIKTFSKPGEYFSVGERFSYSPLSQPEVTVFAEVSYVEDIMRVGESCNRCIIHQWCCKNDNQDENQNYWKPACGRWERRDGDNAYVYFK